MLDASLEVRSAVVYASLIVILVFVPVFFLEGLSGSFFRPLALAYVLAIVASLLVALTVTPALSLLLLTGASERRRESPLVRDSEGRLSRDPAAAGATAGLGRRRCSSRPSPVTGWAVSGLGEEFLPDFQENDFLMHWIEKPGTSLEAMRRITVNVSKELRGVPEVRNFGSHIGRAEVADEVVGPNFTELWISVDPKADHAPTLKKIEKIVAGYPGLVPGRADLPERADQRGADRRRRHGRGAHLRARYGCPPRQGAGDRRA